MHLGTAHHSQKGKLVNTSHQTQQEGDRGFTLIEILIAIVVVGILSAVAVVGIASLTSKGNSSACTASKDAAKAAAVVHYTTTGAYPTTLSAMTTTTPVELSLPTGVTVDPLDTTKTKGAGWTLALTAGGGAVAPTFTCT
ncbi:MAG: hypothetical protein RJA49_1147 [Actinomycetota bacterium]